jgi:hypothetical protein
MQVQLQPISGDPNFRRRRDQPNVEPQGTQPSLNELPTEPVRLQLVGSMHRIAHFPIVDIDIGGMTAAGSLRSVGVVGRALVDREKITGNAYRIVDLIPSGSKIEIARSLLPNSLEPTTAKLGPPPQTLRRPIAFSPTDGIGKASLRVASENRCGWRASTQLE